MVKMNEESQLDRYDTQILRILTKEGRLPVTELAKQIGLSKSPCQVRLRRLQKDGYILGFQAVLNMQKLGREHIAFTEVKLSDTTEKALKAFNDAVQGIQEVEQCHMIAGPFDYLLKVRTSDIRAYRTVLGEEISKLPHVSSTSTYVAMQSIREQFL
ncbi:MAG: Lrp/AsnC family transcriptional regulator [Methyloligellaceae bacterium]